MDITHIQTKTHPIWHWSLDFHLLFQGRENNWKKPLMYNYNNQKNQILSLEFVFQYYGISNFNIGALLKWKSRIKKSISIYTKIFRAIFSIMDTNFDWLTINLNNIKWKRIFSLVNQQNLFNIIMNDSCGAKIFKYIWIIMTKQGSFKLTKLNMITQYSIGYWINNLQSEKRLVWSKQLGIRMFKRKFSNFSPISIRIGNNWKILSFHSRIELCAISAEHILCSAKCQVWITESCNKTYPFNADEAYFFCRTVLLTFTLFGWQIKNEKDGTLLFFLVLTKYLPVLKNATKKKAILEQ